MTGSDNVKVVIMMGSRLAVESVVREERVNLLCGVGFVCDFGDKEGRTRVFGFGGENGVVEEFFGEEIRVSNES